MSTITTTTLLRSNRCGVRQLDVLPEEALRLRSLLLRHGGEQRSAALLPACHNFSMGAALQRLSYLELVLLFVPHSSLCRCHLVEHLVQLAALLLALPPLNEQTLPL